MASIIDILGWRNISTAVQKVETGIPNRLPPEFMSLTEDVLGDKTTYVTFYGQRQTARRAEYGAQSRARTLKQIGEQSVNLLHFAEHIKIRQELFMRLRNPNDLMAQQLAQQEIARHGADFRTLFDNTRVAAIAFMLTTGYVYFDANGNILPTSSGASLTIDYGIGANNRNQLNGLISGSWATTATNIIQDIENVRVQMRRNTGRTLKNIYYGKNVANYLFKNDTLKAYWQFNSKQLEAFNANPTRVPNNFNECNWVYLGDMFYEDANGAVQPIIGDDAVIFAPEIDRNVYTLYQGSITAPKYGLPTVAENLMGAVNGYEIVYGLGGYAVPEVDPVGIKEVYFDTFLPTWKSPLDLFIADVTP